MRVVFTRIDQTLPLFIESIGYDWSQEPVVRSHGYPYYHWLQTTSGQGLITINHHDLLLPANTGLLLAPGIPHQYHALSTDKWTTEYLTFSGREVKHLILTNGANYQIFNHYTDKLAEQFPKNISKTTNPLNLSVTLYRFLLQLSRHSQLEQPVPQTNISVINTVKQYLDSNFQQPISNQQLANLSGFSIQHLIRLFKMLYNTTPLKYLNDLRLRNAQALLVSQPELSVEQIAFQSGFTSASYFISQFHASNGMTPKQFQKLH